MNISGWTLGARGLAKGKVRKWEAVLTFDAWILNRPRWEITQSPTKDVWDADMKGVYLKIIVTATLVHRQVLFEIPSCGGNQTVASRVLYELPHVESSAICKLVSQTFACWEFPRQMERHREENYAWHLQRTRISRFNSRIKVRVNPT